jgi:hypothetical protein
MIRPTIYTPVMEEKIEEATPDGTSSPGEEKVGFISLSVRADEPILRLLCSELEMEPEEVLQEALERGVAYLKMECIAELSEHYENELLRMTEKIAELKQEVAGAREQPAPPRRKTFWNALMGGEKVGIIQKDLAEG